MQHWACVVAHALASAFIANHFSTSDRSQPPEMCFWRKVPRLHQRKRVERLTPTTRTTSVVDIRVSIPANRSDAEDRFGACGPSFSQVRSIGMMSRSGSCTGCPRC